MTEELPSKGMFELVAGDTIRCWTSGGAGFGDPLGRDPNHVLNDIIDGKVSIESANSEYGVIVDEKRLQVNIDETDVRREELQEDRGLITWIYDRGELGRS